MEIEKKFVHLVKERLGNVKQESNLEQFMKVTNP